MKKLSFLVLAIAGMLFAACSSDKDAVGVGPDPVTGAVPDGFMSVNIKLPTTPVMRAANDNFDDGLVAEYSVKDCALLLFQSAPAGNEADATLINAQQIMLPTATSDVDDDNITTSYQAVAKVQDYVVGNNLYALALVNYKNIMTIADGVPTIAGTSLTKGTSTLANVRAIVSAAAMDEATLTTRSGATDYFFMTNAVLSTAQGGVAATAPTAADVFQLATVDPACIKATETEAIADPACDIVVERAVAKATLRVSATQVGTRDIDASKTVWTIDNTEPTTYIVRNPGDLAYIGYSSEAFTTANYRFVGNATTKNASTLGTTADSYRTYWCVDPQYDLTTAPTMNAGTHFIAAGTTTASAPLYCFENTFDVDRQNYKNTTRAIIKVTLDDTTTPIFTYNGVEYAEADAKSYILDNIINNTDIIDAFEDGLNAGKSYTITAASFNATYERDAANGQYKIKVLALSDAVTADCGATKTFKASFPDDIASKLTAAITKANNEVVILEYVNGEMWYEARFQHFAYTADESVAGGYSLAPWNTWEVDPNKPVAGTTTATAYPGNKEQNYLGRYGMVRNNWYDVEVTAFNKLGSPVDPSGNIEKPDTPDDNLEQFISAKIHVLSWAKRTQSWGF